MVRRFSNEAYEKQRNDLRQPTAAERLELARWCLENSLYSQTEAEIAAVLRLEPQRTEARDLLETLDQRRNKRKPEQPVAKLTASVQGSDVHHVRGSLHAAGSEHLPFTTGSAMDRLRQARTGEPVYDDDGPQRGVAGLSTALTQDFIRRVQPLLSNKCGNASCHGRAAEDSCPWITARGNGQQRSVNETNLRTMLRFADRDRDALTRALQPDAAKSPHADLFHGPKGEEQREIVTSWITQASRDQAQASGRPAPRRERLPNAPGTSIVPVAGVRLLGEPTQGSASESEQTDRDFLKRVRDEQRSDPFDPNVFNRLVEEKGR